MKIALLTLLSLLAALSVTRAADQVVTDCSTEAQLQQKILDAQSSGGGTITFTCGPATKIDVPIGLPSIIKDVTIDGGNTIELDGHYATRIFNVVGALTLKNITLRRGNSSSADPGFQDGGAIRSKGTLNISNVKFVDNHSPAGGSAIYSGFGPLSIVDSEFASNQGDTAGAIKVGSSNSSVVIARCNFHQNSAFDLYNSTFGGALYIFDGPSVTVTDCIFSQNSASFGGGIYVTTNCTLDVRNSTFDQNSVHGIDEIRGAGGGVYNRGQTTLSGCTFSKNLARGGSGRVFLNFGQPGAPGEGGAFYNMGPAIAVNCTFAGNQAVGGFGGSIFAGGLEGFGSHGGNGGDAEGGAIYNADELAIFSSTVSGNAAIGGTGGSGSSQGLSGNDEGGGVFTSDTGATKLQNDLVAGNLSDTGPDLFGLFISQGSNLIAKGDGGTGLANGVNHDLIGSIAAPIDPKLGPLQNNGGPTLTMALLGGSPAIDTGKGAPAQDQRGVFRLGLPDIGAFELNGPYFANHLNNISTRAFVGTGDNVLIGGLVVTGTGPKKVLVRALGPTLAQFGVGGALVNPQLELYQGQTLLGTNDDWMGAANASEISASGFAPPNPAEAAILASLNPGNYTAIVRGAGTTSGVALVEGYDLDSAAGSKLGNISTRGFVQTGENVIIAGLVVSGPENQALLIRALGPTLTQFGVPNALTDPILDLRDGNGNAITTNDNWKTNQQADIQATPYPPPIDSEAAILITLAPGNYTAILSGVGNTTGNALVEIYALD